jgi:hypothetical protein
MDLEIQKRVKELAEKEGKDNLVILLGGAEAEAAGLAAETVITGDPTFAGPLAGVALGLSVYHIVEPEIKALVDADVYEEQCGMMEMVLDVDEIVGEMNDIRNA